MNEIKTPLLRGCDKAKIIQLIETRAVKGAGTENDPYREVIQYWTFDGELLFEKSDINSEV